MSVLLAHLSDPHLPLEALPSPRQLLNKRFVSIMSWLGNRRHIHQSRPLALVMQDIAAHTPDALAVTGDLTNLGTREECLTAARWLGNIPTPRAVIPGNHDTLVRAPWDDGPGLWRHLGGMADPHTPVLLKVGDVALIGVSSAISTPPFFATGRVDRTQLEHLAALLETTGREGLCRVVLIHHPPRHGMVLRHKSLLDLERFADIVRVRGAEMILHGHSHKGTLSTLEQSDIPLVGVTSASHRAGRSLARAAGWNRIRIDRVAGMWEISVEARRLSPDGRLYPYRTTRLARPAPERGAVKAERRNQGEAHG